MENNNKNLLILKRSPDYVNIEQAREKAFSKISDKKVISTHRFYTTKNGVDFNVI